LKVSIITVTYNSEATIRETVLSVLGQTHKNIEYIVIDGASSDNTLSILHEFKDRISTIVSENDKGIYDALNKGIQRATGDVIGLLHSDDIFAGREVIADYARVFSEQDTDAVYADLHYVDKTNTDKIIRNWKSGQYKPGMFLRGWMPPHPTFFVRREIYLKYGVFSPELRSAADYELMLRFIHRYHIKLVYLPKVTVKMRVGGKSNVTLRNRIHANLEDRKAWKMNNLRPAFYTLYLKPLRKIIQFF
jgi:glycosyltransferase involved in cell wall biosynthesis